MSRPRRAASQKVVQEQKLDLSELEESDDDDFSSQSSDEYQPDESKENEKTFEESESEGLIDENETSEDEVTVAKNNKPNR